MNTTEILIIRACKGNNTEERLKSIYRRFWNGEVDKFSHEVMKHQMIRIVDEYDLTTVSELLKKIDDNRKVWFPKQQKISYDKALLEALISTIRYCKIEKIPNLPEPTRFKNSGGRHITQST